MATTLVVKCKNCENSFNYYWHTFDSEKDICCPHCDRKLDKQYVEKYVKPAFDCVHELNYKIRGKYQSNYCDNFEFNFEEVFVPSNKFKS